MSKTEVLLCEIDEETGYLLGGSPIVHCKDCIYNYGGEYCENDIYIKPDGYCHWGEKKGEKMILSGEYSLIYDKSHNRITIGLPQTSSTLTNTIESVADRRTDVEEKDLFVLLDITKLIFDKAGRKKDAQDV